ncbi:hypothetical protein FACS1894142_7020 [Spirochaetia bacterium]|nr:hypothetical protein FACS1894142_7020 [Spirochaetia bacterium]
MPLLDKPLHREEIKNVIEGKGAARRIPMAIHTWISADTFGPRAPEYKAVLDSYPCDVEVISLNMPQIFDAPKDDPSYRWLNFDNPYTEGTALDAVAALDDWAKLGGVLADFPNPNYHGLITKNPPPDTGAYRAGHWWYWLFERFWSIRGMENALCDFYENPDEVHRLFRALTDFYKGAASRGKKELGLDAIWTSDDIGMQTSPFFSIDVFREFFKPYYKELIDHVHSLGMHFWLHACGNIKPFIPDLIEIGLDVIHPIQKYTMDEKEIAAQFGKDICIWGGMDVQRTIPYGTPEDVRKEVRFMFDTYHRKDGRFMLTAGNGMTKDTPLESLKALLDEALQYGIRICEKQG